MWQSLRTFFCPDALAQSLALLQGFSLSAPGKQLHQTICPIRTGVCMLHHTIRLKCSYCHKGCRKRGGRKGGGTWMGRWREEGKQGASHVHCKPQGKSQELTSSSKTSCKKEPTARRDQLYGVRPKASSNPHQLGAGWVCQHINPQHPLAPSSRATGSGTQRSLRA